MRKGTHLPPRTPEHRRAISTRMRGNQYAADALRRAAERRRVVFDPALEKELLACRKRGWNVEMIAAWLGVGRGTVMRELKARDMPTGRWRRY